MSRASRIWSRLAVLAVLATAAAAHAEGGGHGGGHGEPHVANWWHVGSEYAGSPALGLLMITFVIFVVGLVVLVRPKLSVYLENRSDDVRKAIEEAQRARKAAEERARAAEQKLANLEGEMVRLKADFEAQGKAELERVEKLAQEAAARIARDAEDTINAERERAELALRTEAARLALDLAETRIRGALNADDDARLQRALVAGLEVNVIKGGEA